MIFVAFPYVLFLTKKKAIKSIEDDYDVLNPNYNILVINYESLHKVAKIKWDLIILDEAHSLGAFPIPNKRAKQVAQLVWNLKSYVILLSGPQHLNPLVKCIIKYMVFQTIHLDNMLIFISLRNTTYP